MVKITIISTTSIACLFLVLLAAPATGAKSPHWDKFACQACHVDAHPSRGDAQLSTPSAEEACVACHNGGKDAVSCPHESDLEVGNRVLPGAYRAALEDDRVVCTTCHDLVYQCEHPNPAYSYQNPGFLRNRVSHSSADQCFECHDAGTYRKLNPHAGTFGPAARPTCLLCHENMPHTAATEGLEVTFNMPDDLNDTCRGCHAIESHPRGMSVGNQADDWVHLTVPSADVLARMNASAAATQVVLPLEPGSGEIYCATCHNPHAYLASQEHLLRQEHICQACHDK